MSTPIRPNLPLPPTPRPAAASDGARAAQRAFFAQALNGAQASIAQGSTAQAPIAQPPVVQSAAPAAAPVRQAAQAAAQQALQAIQQGETPPRPLRPGSLLDIRI